MKILPLTYGQVALVDDEDFEGLSKYKWRAFWNRTAKTFYAQRYTRAGRKTRTVVRMHRQILGFTDRRVQVDHIDHDGLNNQRHNLRPATHAQNDWNRRKQQGCSSIFKGVSWSAQRGRWLATITIPGAAKRSRKVIGGFKEEEHAARAYDAAAIKYYGEFAHLNF